MSKRGFVAALIQLCVGKDKTLNLAHAADKIKEAKSAGAKVVALPECFNSPYGVNFFKEYAESVPGGETSEMLSRCAKEYSIYVVGGSYPEKENSKFFNTCTVWSPAGELLAKFRKMHLFDIDIPGGITFKESDVLKAGDELATFCVDDCRVGLGICYDLRFDEMAKLYRKQGCEVLMYPGAFNMTTGPIHWDLLQRARAVDNQVYVCTISPARGEKGYISWAHSQCTDPWGKVIQQASTGEEILYCDIDLAAVTQVRQQIPVFPQRRLDVYDTVEK